MFSYKICISLLIFTQSSLSLDEDYYWRQYTGRIPTDAIAGGEDIFIGQAYVQGEGLIVSEISPGVREVRAPIVGIKNINKYIKILCGHPYKLYWTPSNSTHLHLQLIGKRPVLGGHEKSGALYVGRISAEGTTKIGKITAFNVGNALMYYEQDGNEKFVSTYEVLLYEDVFVDPRIMRLKKYSDSFLLNKF